MRGRKGLAEQQFHWIFVMIAGTVILIFFISVVMKQKDISESKVALSVMQDLETVTTGAGVSKGTAQSLNKPDFDLDFDCSGCLCKYSMQENDKLMQDKIIFAPRRITGRRIIAWTKDWNAPFRIVNFLFLTSPLTKYYLIYNDGPTEQMAKEINSSLPTDLNKELVDVSDLGSLEDQNYPVVKLVYLNTDIQASHGQEFADWDIDPRDLTAVNITSAHPYITGRVQFYTINDFGQFEAARDSYNDAASGEIDFIGEESLYAAIFAHDYDMFACNMKNAFEKMTLITYIYIKRTEELYTVGSCGALYDDALTQLEQLNQTAVDQSKDITQPLTGYSGIQEALDEDNLQLQINSCTPVY